MKLKLFIVVAAAFVLSSFSSAKEIRRDQASVTVQGHKEVWQLRWQKSPHGVKGCWYDQIESAITCPCIGIAYGEAAPLVLVRTKNGHDIERLDLASPFEIAGDFGYPIAQGESALMKFPLGPDDTGDKAPSAEVLAKLIPQRKPAKILKMVDVDHDGEKTEFLLTVGTAPCGKEQQVAVGVSKENPNLHFFTSTSKLTQPLLLASYEWDALLQNKGPVTVVDWRCADHGADIQTELELAIQNGKIKGRKIDYKCDADGQKGHFLKAEDL